jgi:hypothetical protein
MAITLDELRRERAAEGSGSPSAPEVVGRPLTLDELVAEVQGATPKKKSGVAQDMAKSAAIGVPRGVADLLGLPAGLAQLGQMGANWVAKKAGAEAPGEVNPISMFMPPGLDRIAPLRALQTALPRATGENIERAAESVTGQWYDPQTRPGKFAERVVRGAVSTPGAKVTGAAASGGGEVGAQTYGEGARLPFSLVGGFIPGAYQTMRGTISQNAADALQNVTPQQMKAAQALMDRAQAAGSPLTAAEAIAQVSGKNSLQDIQRVVEQSGKGGPIMQPMMNARPDANRAAFNRTLDGIGPAPANPSQTPVALQEAASKALTDARQAGNAAATPFYTAARTQSVPAPVLQRLRADPVIDIAIKNVLSDPKWGVKGRAPDSIAVLDQAKKWLDAQAQKSAKVPAEARIWSDARKALTGELDAVSPAYATARGIVEQNRRTVVDPMRASPVGDLANTKGLSAENAMAAQRQILMPPSPAALNPQTINYTGGLLSGPPLRNFTRQGLLSQYDEATQNLVSGPNQWGGAKFAAQVAGNPSQKANLEALVTQAGGTSAWKGFQNFLEIVEAQGKRHPAGSLTEFNKQVTAGLSREGAGGLLATAAAPARAASIAKDWYDAFRYGKNTGDMAKILTNPKGVEILNELAVTAPGSARAGVLVGALTELSRATQDEAAPQPSPKPR